MSAQDLENLRKATSDDIEAIIIMPMIVQYAPPPHLVDQKDKWPPVLAGYLELLAGVPVGRLRQAWRVVLKTHDRWTWPLPSAFWNALYDPNDQRWHA